MYKIFFLAQKLNPLHKLIRQNEELGLPLEKLGVRSLLTNSMLQSFHKGPFEGRDKCTKHR